MKLDAIFGLSVFHIFTERASCLWSSPPLMQTMNVGAAGNFLMARWVALGTFLVVSLELDGLHKQQQQQHIHAGKTGIRRDSHRQPRQRHDRRP